MARNFLKDFLKSDQWLSIKDAIRLGLAAEPTNPTLQQQLESAHSTIAYKDRLIAEFHGHMAEMNEMHEYDLANEKASHTRTRENLSTQLSHLTDTLTEEQNTTSALRYTLAASRDLVAIQAKELEDSATALADSREENIRLGKTLEISTKVLQGQVETLTAKASALTTEIVDLKAQQLRESQEAKATIAEREAVIAELTRELAQERETSRKLGQDFVFERQRAAGDLFTQRAETIATLTTLEDDCAMAVRGVHYSLPLFLRRPGMIREITNAVSARIKGATQDVVAGTLAAKIAAEAPATASATMPKDDMSDIQDYMELPSPQPTRQQTAKTAQEASTPSV